jgi:hypothetical protein
MKFCPVVPEVCRGQVHVPKKERRIKRRKRIIIIIIIRNGAKTISLPKLINTHRYSTMPKVKIISTWLPTSNELHLGFQIFVTI